jgi:gamma-glutamyl:cysteine ligase YbdK (ATP-grasp superfamily)
MQDGLTIGFELELCLLDKQGDPACINAAFLTRLQELNTSDQCYLQITPELAQFNIELNSLVFHLTGSVLQDLEDELKRLESQCQKVAQSLDCSILMIGSLPTLCEQHLTLKNMSPMVRYKALNEQVLRTRQGQALELNIQGSETLKSVHQNVMLEAAATSFQLHLQIPFSRSVRYYNAAIILSAPIVALSANSPFLFGKALWCETRIPIFEQAVAVGGFQGAVFGPIKRVSFGSGYAQHSLLECFVENDAHYPVLLPEVFKGEINDLTHFSLHNGTIWRWNRPLLAFTEDDEKKRDYQLRLEHRVIPAGPTIVDSIANAAFFYGAITALANQYVIPEQQLPFVQAKENFYRAAKHGLKGKITWCAAQNIPIKALILDQLLPLARDGLNQMGIARKDINYYLNIIEQRVHSGQNGALWQRRYVEKYGNNMHQLTQAYLIHQEKGHPVHTWSV